MELVHARARRRMSRGLKRKPMALIKRLRKAKKGVCVCDRRISEIYGSGQLHDTSWPNFRAQGSSGEGTDEVHYRLSSQPVTIFSNFVFVWPF